MSAECGYHETQYSINCDRDGNRYKALFYLQPFNQGANRYAFKGILNGNGPRKGDACVTKVFKKEFANNFDQWMPDLKASEKSLTFAQQFNSDCIPKFSKNQKKIDFLIPLIAKMNHEYVAIEPFLEGQYKKFNSNGGLENAIHDLMQAFSHWTWSISNHQFMVCDLQGIERDDKFILTDPAVHSYEKKYGMTDLGVVGMEMVLAKHDCNSLCGELGLQNHVADEEVFIPRISTTFIFQLSEEEKHRALNGQSIYF